MIRRLLHRRALRRLGSRRAELAMALREHPHPHTQGTYDGITYAIAVLTGDD